MATTTVNMELKLKATDIAKANKEAASLRGNLEGAQKAASIIKTAAAARATPGSAAITAANAAGSSIDDKAYGVVRGTLGTGAAGRDFAKQSQGLGGIVQLYATFAANLFAVGAAYEALNKAAAAERLAKATEMMSVQVGANLKGISNNLVEASGHAISFQDAMQFTNIGTSAGLAGKQIENLTKIARGAASALGRDVNDSVRRIIQGTAKQEQEILDELGIFVKSKQAFDKYSKEIGVKAEDLTGRQRTQAYANEVERLGKKWEAFAEIEDPFSKFAATGKNALNELLSSVNQFVKPVLSMLSESESAVKALIVLVSTMLAKRVVPELGGMFNSVFNYDKQLGAAKHAQMMADLDRSLADVEKKILASNTRIAELNAKANVQSMRDSMYGVVGASAATMVGGKYDIPGIKQRLLATEIVGTDKNPKNLALITSELAVQEKITSNLKNQLKDEATREVILGKLIQAGTIELGSSQEKLILTQRTKDIASRIYTEIVVPGAVAQAAQNTQIAIGNKLLETKSAIVAKTNELQTLGGKGVARSALLPNIVGTEAESMANAGLSASQEKVAATANIEAEALNRSTSAQNAATEATLLATAANNKEAVSNEVAAAAKKAKTAQDILAMKGNTAEAGQKASILFSQGIKGILPALSELGVGMKVALAGFTTTAGGAKLFAGSLAFVKLGIQGIIGTLGALVTPLLVAYTVWEMFGDKIKDMLPDWAKSALGMDEVSKATEEVTKRMEEYSKSVGFAAANLEMLNKVRGDTGEGFESLEDVASYSSSIAKNITNQIEEYKRLKQAKEDANNVSLLDKAKKDAESLGMVFSKEAYNLTSMSESIKNLVPASTLSDMKKLGDTFQELESRRELGKSGKVGGISEVEYQKQINKLLEEKNALLLKVQVPVAQQESSAAKAVSGAKSMNDALDEQAKKINKLGAEHLGLNNATATKYYQGFIDILNAAAPAAIKLTNAEDSLVKAISLGGATAAATIPVWIAYNTVRRALELAVQDGSISVEQSQQALATWLEQNKGMLLSIASSMNTIKPPKAVEEYAKLSKEWFRELGRDIKEYDLGIKSAEVALKNLKNQQEDNAAVRGFKTKEETTSIFNAEEARADLQLQKDRTAAAKAFAEVEQSKTKTVEEKSDARSTLEYTLKTLDSTREASKIDNLRSQTQDDIKRNLDIINAKYERTKTLTENNNALQQASLGIALARLDVLKNSGIYTEAEIVSMSGTLQQKTAQLAIEQQLAALKIDKSKDIEVLKAKVPDQTSALYLDEEKKINDLYASRAAQMLGLAEIAKTILGITLEQEVAQARANDSMKVMEELGSSIEGAFSGIASAIGDAGSSFEKFGSGMSKTLVAAQKYSTIISKSKEEEVAAQAKLNNAIKGEVSSEEELASLEEDLNKKKKKATNDELDGISSTAGAAKQMFSEKTAAYKILNGMETAAHLLKMGNLVLEVDASAPAIMASFFRVMGPFAWPAIGLALAAIGASGSGGSSVSSVGLTAEDMQQSQGTGQSWVNGELVDNGGGVFGDTSAKSNSIQNSLELLAENSIDGLSFANDQIKLLEKINDGIGIVAEAAYGTQGIRTGTGFGTVESSTSNPGFLNLWGSSSSTEIINAGIKLQGTFASLSTAGDGIIKQFETVQNTETSSFLFWSDTDVSINTAFKDLETKAETAIRETFDYMGSFLVDQGEQLGLTAEETLARANSISINVAASLRDLSGSETQEELNAIFSSILDDAAMAVAPQLAKFHNFGEGMAETVTRVIDDFDKVNLAMESMGQDIISFVEVPTKVTTQMLEDMNAANKVLEEAKAAVPTLKWSWEEGRDTGSGGGSGFPTLGSNQAEIDEATKLVNEAEEVYAKYAKIVTDAERGMTTQGYDLSEALIKAAGGLDKFLEASQLYAEVFMTEGERMVIQNALIKERFAEIGELSSPVTTLATELFKTITDGNDRIIDTRKEYQAAIDSALAISKEAVDSEDSLGQARRQSAIDTYAALTDPALLDSFNNYLQFFEDSTTTVQDALDSYLLATGATTDAKLNERGYATAFDNLVEQFPEILDDGYNAQLTLIKLVGMTSDEIMSQFGVEGAALVASFIEAGTTLVDAVDTATESYSSAHTVVEGDPAEVAYQNSLKDIITETSDLWVEIGKITKSSMESQVADIIRAADEQMLAIKKARDPEHFDIVSEVEAEYGNMEGLLKKQTELYTVLEEANNAWKGGQLSSDIIEAEKDIWELASTIESYTNSLAEVASLSLLTAEELLIYNENIAAKVAKLYADAKQTILDTYPSSILESEASASVAAAGYNVSGKNSSEISKFFYELAEGADIATAEGQATISSITDLAGAIGVLKAEADNLTAWQDKLSLLEGSRTQREIDLAAVTSEATRSLMQQVWALEDKNATEELNIRLLTAEKKTSQALLLTRQKELKTLSATDAAIQSRIWMLEDTEALRVSYLSQEQEIVTLLQGSQAALVLARAEELANMEEQLRPRQQYLWALQDEASIRDEMTSKVSSNIDSLKGFITSLKSARDALLLSDKSTLSPVDKYLEAKKQMDAVTEAAMAVATTDSEIASRNEAINKLPEVTNSFLDASRGLYASSEQYTKDFNSVLDILDSTSANLVVQQTAADKQLTELTTISSTLTTIESLTTQLVLAQEATAAALAVYQASGTGGVGTSTPFTPTVADVSSDASRVQVLYDKLAGRVGETEGVAYWINEIARGASKEDIIKAFAYSVVAVDPNANKLARDIAAGSVPAVVAGFASGGLANGLAVVGENGPELVDFATPSRVYSNAASNQLLSQKELVEEIRNLRKEVAELRKEQNEQTGHIINANYDANNVGARQVVAATKDLRTANNWTERNKQKFA